MGRSVPTIQQNQSFMNVSLISLEQKVDIDH